MKKQFIDLVGDEFEVDFKKHDISKYDVLFHVTLKDNVKSIKEKGLLVGQPLCRSLVSTDMLFLSYPVDMTTSDCFRWRDLYCALIVLDAKLLREDNVEFYDDYFSDKDQSSKRNHLACNQDIDVKYIKQVVEF